MTNIKILITYKEKHKIIESDILTPIQTGRAICDEKFEGMIGDDSGNNISDKNEKFSEVSAQYWAWKNFDKLENPDYIGFMHYRRNFIFNNKKYKINSLGLVDFERIDEHYRNEINLNDKDIMNFVKDYDLFVIKKIDLKKLARKNDLSSIKNPRGAYKANPFLNVKDYDLMLKLVKKMHPEYIETINLHEKCNYQYWYNMFIMKKELFNKYNEFAMPILFELEKQIDMTKYPTPALRTLGYLSERLLTLFIIKLQQENIYKIKEINATFVKNTESEENLFKKYKKEKIKKTAKIPENIEINPAFKDNSVAIALSSSDFFVPYLTTTLYSLIKNADMKKNYDIVIFTKDIQEQNRKIINNFLSKSNVSIRFVNVIETFGDLKLHTDANVTIETYFRLIVPFVMKKYEKVLFLDSDLIIQSNICELYDIDLKNYPLAASVECLMSALIGRLGSYMLKYLKDVLKLKEIDKYFQAGVMLFNIKLFNEKNYGQTLLNMVANYNYKIVDQDALNELFKGNILFIPTEWNYVPMQKHMKELKYVENMSDEIREKYLAVKKPKIIHFADKGKPWYDISEKGAWNFWKYAIKTPFFNTIVLRLLQKTFRKLILFYKIQRTI